LFIYIIDITNAVANTQDILHGILYYEYIFVFIFILVFIFGVYYQALEMDLCNSVSSFEILAFDMTLAAINFEFFVVALSSL